MRLDADSIYERMKVLFMEKYVAAGYTRREVVEYMDSSFQMRAVAETMEEIASQFESSLQDVSWDTIGSVPGIISGALYRGYSPLGKRAPIGIIAVSTHAEYSDAADFTVGETYFQDEKVRIYDEDSGTVKLFTCTAGNASESPLDADQTSWVEIEPSSVEYSQDNDLTLDPASMLFEGENGQYVFLEKIILSKDEPVAYLACYAAERHEAENNSYDPSSFNGFSLDFEGIDIEKIEVTQLSTTGDIPWRVVRSKYEASGDEKVMIATFEDGYKSVKMTFGDGTFGAIPDRETRFRIVFYTTEGTESECTVTAVIDEVSSPAYITGTDGDLEENQVRLYCWNFSGFANGSDEDTLEDVRANAKATFLSGGGDGRLVTVNDYKDAIAALSFIADVNVWGPEVYRMETSKDPLTYVPDTENFFYCCPVHVDGRALTAQEELMIREELQPRVSPGDAAKFEVPKFVNLMLVSNVKVSDSSQKLSECREALEAHWKDYFDWLNLGFKAKISETKYKGSVYKKEEFSWLDYHDTELYIVENEYNTGGLIVGDFDVPNVLPGTVTLDMAVLNDDGDIIGWESILVDDNLDGTAGRFIPVTGGQISVLDSTISYSQNIFSIKIDTTQSPELQGGRAMRIRYQASIDSSKNTQMLSNQLTKFAGFLEHNVVYSS